MKETKRPNSKHKEPAAPVLTQQNNGQFEVTVGQKVEVLDFCNIWRLGEVRRLDTWDKTVCVHYDGCDDAGSDEWFEIGSGRLRPLKKDTTNTFKIPKAVTDRAKQLALENIAPSDTGKSDLKGMVAKERKVAQFRKGTYVIATWVDGKIYPAMVARILSELSFLVEFVDGTRWALGSHCLTRTLTKTEYERLVENPDEANEILGPRIHNRVLMSPQSPKDAAPPPRKRFRLTSPPAPPSSSLSKQRSAKPTEPPVSKRKGSQHSPKKISTSRKSLPSKNVAPAKGSAVGKGKLSSRKSCAPTLGGLGSSFKSKASVRSVSPLPEQHRASSKLSSRSDSIDSDEPLIVAVKFAKKKRDEDCHITGVGRDEDLQVVAVEKDDDLQVVGVEAKRRVSTRNKQPEKENVRKSSRRNSKKTEMSQILASIPSKKVLNLVSRPHSSLGFSSKNNVTISVEETKTKTKVRFSKSDFQKPRRETRFSTRVSVLKGGENVAPNRSKSSMQ